MLSTFELLPDEILMIIIRYSGDIITIFRTFTGLNQRINNILIDKRTHLLTDFLFTDNNNINIDDYYKSELFHNMLTKNDQQLRQSLQSLVTLYIQNKYKQSATQLELDMKQFQSKRMHVPTHEIINFDRKLEKLFKELQECSKPMKNIKQIESLIVNEGARLEFPNNDYRTFNFTQAFNHLLLLNISNVEYVSQRYINSLIRMFKLLIISNLKLLYNLSYVGNGSCVIYYFLFHAIYRCQEFNCRKKFPCFNIQYYQGAVDFLLFAIQCLKYELVNKDWWINSFLDLCKFIHPIQLSIDQEIFVYTSQIEILKIIFNENILYKTILVDDDDLIYELSKSISNLIVCYRLDIICFLFHYNVNLRNFLLNCWKSLKFINILIGNQKRRKLFHNILDDKFIGLYLITNTDLLFILLQKKEKKLIKKLFYISPLLIHRLDKDENDALLYICLKVCGCRHRLVEYLIKMKCNLQRRNLNNENFIDVLQFKRNKNLLKKLIDYEIIQINYETNEINVNLIQ